MDAVSSAVEPKALVEEPDADFAGTAVYLAGPVSRYHPRDTSVINGVFSATGAARPAAARGAGRGVRRAAALV